MKHALALIALFSFCHVLNAQVIKGKVYLDGRPLEYASVVVSTEQDSLLGSYLSGKDGNFQTEKFGKRAVFVISASYVGTNGYRERFKVADLASPLSIKLETIRETIDTVGVSAAQNRTTLDLDKRTYRFDPNDFIKNTTADIAINKVPGIVFAEGFGLKLDGTRSVVLYVDGIAANTKQLGMMDVSDIEQVDILHNPSASFGADKNIAIINIITKKSPEAFYKGKLGLTKGTLLESTGADPSFSFKKGKWLAKAYVTYSKYDQETHTDVFRNSSEAFHRQSSDREYTTEQGYANTDIQWDIDTASFLFLRSNYYNQQLSGTTIGKIGDDAYTNRTGDRYWIYSADGVYNRSSKNGWMSVKTKYNTYRQNDSYALEGSSPMAGRTSAGLSDFSGHIVYGHSPKLFAKTDHDFGAKYVNRTFLMARGENLRQHNMGLYSDWRIRLNGKIGLSPSLYLDMSRNEVNGSTTTYTSLLPSVSLSLKSGKTGQFSLSYRRSVSRPHPTDLNEDIVILDPTTIQKGNAALRQSATNSFSARYANPYRKNFLSASVFYSRRSRSIFEDVENRQDTLIFTKANIGNIQRFGATLDHDLALAPGISLYTSAGINYNRLEKGGNERLFRSGYGFTGTVSLSARLLKVLTTSAMFDYNSRRYDLYSVTQEWPFTNLVISGNVLKDKVNLRLLYRDLFRIYARREVHLVSPNFTQDTYQRRNLSNISLSVTYSFGKKFSDRVSARPTQNDDIDLRQ